MPFCIALSALVAGCSTTHVAPPPDRNWSDNDPHARTEFWSGLSARPVATNDEAFHALLLYADGTDPATDYAGRVRLLQSRKLLPADFHGGADEPVNRGTLAVALVQILKVDGGVTMRLLGPTPRYAVRALEFRGVYPTSSPNQGLSGGTLVGIIQRAEEYERGNPADAPAAFLPTEITHPGGPLAAAAARKAAATPEVPELTLVAVRPENFQLTLASVPPADGAGPAVDPLFLVDTEAPTTAPAAPKRLSVIITGVEGEAAEVRKTEADPWVRAKSGMVLRESAEFRTGPKSAIRFIIPPDQTFCVDSLGTIKVLQAVQDGRKIKTDVGLARGRVRYDVDKGAALAAAGGGGGAGDAEPARIEQAGLEHDAAIRSPNSALALRGTKVSLFDQPEFDPEAISLTGRAVYVNTLGRRVPFGGRRAAAVHGAQGSAAQQAAARANGPQSPDLARSDFENREIALVIQRGGFVRGDVVVGNLHLADFPKLPGSLDFVLQWSGGPQQNLNDLNLAVLSPKNTLTSPDFVANAPFTVSLNPSSPASKQIRATSYPKTSPSGGQISKNSVGPDGLELAFWGKNYPVGTYRVVVFNLLDAKPPPSQTTNPVTYTIDVFLNGQKLTNTFTGSVGFLQTSPALLVPVPATTAGAAPRTATTRTPVLPAPTHRGQRSK